MIDTGLILSYILFLVATFGALAFPVMFMIKHPKEARMALAAIGALIVIFFLSWLISGSELTEKDSLLGISSSESKLIGAGLITSYIIFVITIISTFGSQIKSLIVNR